MNTTTSTKPSTLGLTPSFGFGDRLGFATPGHLAALQQHGGPIAGIFAQQSIREMTRTERTATQVMACAADALDTAQYKPDWGADADHLKTPADVDLTADAGFVFFTIDPSDHVDQQADNYDAAALQAKYLAPPWADQYLGKTLRIADSLTLNFDPTTVQRAAVKYAAAIDHALKLADYIKHAADQRDQPHEIEVSIDETDQPTTLHEHYIIADQLKQAGIELVSLAPRFIGDLEKASTTSATSTNSNAHSPTTPPSQNTSAPTSSRSTPAPTKSPCTPRSAEPPKDNSTSRPPAPATSKPSVSPQSTPPTSSDASSILPQPIRHRQSHLPRPRHPRTRTAHRPLPRRPPARRRLPRTLERRPEPKGFTKPGRQILHCTFGSVLTDPDLGPELLQLLREHPDTYAQVLTDHFARHLQALRAG